VSSSGPPAFGKNLNKGTEFNWRINNISSSSSSSSSNCCCCSSGNSFIAEATHPVRCVLYEDSSLSQHKSRTRLLYSRFIKKYKIKFVLFSANARDYGYWNIFLIILYVLWIFRDRQLNVKNSTTKLRSIYINTSPCHPYISLECIICSLLRPTFFLRPICFQIRYFSTLGPHLQRWRSYLSYSQSVQITVLPSKQIIGHNKSLAIPNTR
jgi:hypothetical protein